MRLEPELDGSWQQEAFPGAVRTEKGCGAAIGLIGFLRKQRYYPKNRVSFFYVVAKALCP